MGKAIRNIIKLETLVLTEHTDGFWLYDYTVGMNLAMRAKTEQAAFIEALLYYQKRLTKLNADYKELDGKVETFLSMFRSDDDD
jgi:hypothetical protein